MNIEATEEEIQALASLLDATVRYHGSALVQNGAQSLGPGIVALQAAQSWLRKLRESLNGDES